MGHIAAACRFSLRQSRKKFCIARKWRQHLACQPQPEPSWLLFLHPQMGRPAGGSEAHEGPPKHPKLGRRRAAAPQEHTCDSRAHGQQEHTKQEGQQHPQQKQYLREQHDPQQQQKQEQQHVQQQLTATADCVGAFRRLQGTYGERPPFCLSYDPKEIFCVLKSSVSAQHKARSPPKQQQQ